MKHIVSLSNIATEQAYIDFNREISKSYGYWARVNIKITNSANDNVYLMQFVHVADDLGERVIGTKIREDLIPENFGAVCLDKGFTNEQWDECIEVEMAKVEYIIEVTPVLV